MVRHWIIGVKSFPTCTKVLSVILVECLKGWNRDCWSVRREDSLHMDEEDNQDDG